MNEIPGRGIERFLRFALGVTLILLIWTAITYKAPPECPPGQEYHDGVVLRGCMEKE